MSNLVILIYQKINIHSSINVIIMTNKSQTLDMTVMSEGGLKTHTHANVMDSASILNI